MIRRSGEGHGSGATAAASGGVLAAALDSRTDDTNRGDVTGRKALIQSSTEKNSHFSTAEDPVTQEEVCTVALRLF